jgi:cell division septum initiation protein DivIVA
MDNEQPSTKFRITFRGYNKDDVSGYIEKINAQFISAEKGYKKQIDTLTGEAAELNKKLTNRSTENSAGIGAGDIGAGDDIAVLKRRIDELTKQNAEYEQLISSQDEKIEAMKTESEKLNSERNNLTADIEKANATIEELNSVIKLSKDYIEKAALYDKMSSQIGSMIIHANEKADEILFSANEKADAVVFEANTQSVNMMSETDKDIRFIKAAFKEQIGFILQNINETIKSANDNYNHDFTSLQGEILSKFQDIIQLMKDRADTLQAKLIFSNNELISTINDELESLSKVKYNTVKLIQGSKEDDKLNVL